MNKIVTVSESRTVTVHGIFNMYITEIDLEVEGDTYFPHFEKILHIFFFFVIKIKTKIVIINIVKKSAKNNIIPLFKIKLIELYKIKLIE